VVSIDRCNTHLNLEVVLSSTRRVKKGPAAPTVRQTTAVHGTARPGWGIHAAAREVEASPAAGQNWASGYTLYRDGKTVKTVAPLDRLAVRKISPRYLSEDERIQIADLRRDGVSVAGTKGRRQARGPHDGQANGPEASHIAADDIFVGPAA
jgi:hypothetical protein